MYDFPGDVGFIEFLAKAAADGRVFTKFARRMQAFLRWIQQNGALEGVKLTGFFF